MKKQIEKILREAGRKAIPIEEVRDAIMEVKGIKKEAWDTWDIEKITKDFKVTIRIEKRI